MLRLNEYMCEYEYYIVLRLFSTIIYIQAIMVHPYILDLFIHNNTFLTYVILMDTAIPTGLVFGNANNFSSDDKLSPR